MDGLPAAAVIAAAEAELACSLLQYFARRH